MTLKEVWLGHFAGSPRGTAAARRQRHWGSFGALKTAAALLLAGAAGSAPALVLQAGSQNLADGQLLDGIAAWEAASAGEPAPFAAFTGNDFASLFAASWHFSFAPQAVFTASIEIGLFDHDSAAPGSQLARFAMDGFDLTAALDAAFEARGGLQNQANVYKLALPATVLPLLADGQALFELQLQGPGLHGAPGSCCSLSASNGAGLDFARLTLAVPEPAAGLMFTCGLLPLALLARRRRAVQERDTSAGRGPRVSMAADFSR